MRFWSRQCGRPPRRRELGDWRARRRERADRHAEHLTPAVAVDRAAMVTATETMRPASRTFT